MKKNSWVKMLAVVLCSCEKEISQKVADPSAVDVYVAGTEIERVC